MKALLERYHSNIEKGANFLSATDIDRLEANGNFAKDWKDVKITCIAGDCLDRIQNCSFQGNIVIGKLNDEVRVESIGNYLPAGKHMFRSCYRFTI